MSDLVKRLSSGSHSLVFGRPGASGRAAELKAAIDRKYVLLEFTETRGGTELGVPLDTAACDLSAADFARGEGRIHLEGEFRLDYVPVRLVADVDLATLQGEGQLRVTPAAGRS
ncbi:MAG: hypothetical protein RL685_5490 [Pseudomonadota bacterium]|jgi:hypothetical protein